MRQGVVQKNRLAVLKRESFLTPSGKLPGFAQRRLDLLIAKSKSGELDRTEKRELRDMLDYIDRKSVQMLKNAAGQKELLLSAK